MEQKEIINLVTDACKKDNTAMEKIYKLYYEDVYFVCKKYELSDEDAADVTQDTFIKAFSSLDSIENAAKFKPWILRIAGNNCLNLLKHRNIINFSSIDDEEHPIEIEDEKKSTLDTVIDDETASILNGIINTLPIEQRVTVFMHYYQDMSVKEIANAYGCSENTVRSRLNYAKKTMRAEAEKLEDKGIKLRVVAALPFLGILFGMQRKAFACEIPDCTEVIAKTMTRSPRVMENMGKSIVKKTVKGKIIAGVVATAVIAGAAAGIYNASSNGKTTTDVENETTTNIVENETTNSDMNKETIPEIKDDDNGFIACDTDVYREKGTSTYIAFPILETDKPFGYATPDYDKNIVVVLDFKDAVENEFKKMLFNESYGYHSGLGNDNLYIKEYVTGNNEGSSAVTAAKIDGFYEGVYLSEDSDYIDFDYYKKEYIDEDYFKGEGWFAHTSIGDYLYSVSLIIGEDDTYFKTISMPLANPISMENISNEIIDMAVKTNDFSCSVLLMEDINDNNSVVKTYGPEVDLSDVSFYTDMLSNTVSDVYGLNIKEKDCFFMQKPTLVSYAKRISDDRVLEIRLCNLKDPDDERHTREYYDKAEIPDEFSYTDSQGNKFEYFVEEENIVRIFKNGEYSGNAYIDKSEDEIKDLTALFGIRK